LALQDTDVIMAVAGIEDEEDPFERIQRLEEADAVAVSEGAFAFQRRRRDRLSLIPEESESTCHSIQSMVSHGVKVQIPSQPIRSSCVPLFTSESRQVMESKINPGLIDGLLIVHESALAKVRTLEKTVGRDGTGGNHTVSALRIANGHFFIERRLTPTKMFLAVDLEADISSGRCNQWALKILSPPNLWEPYILSRLKDSPTCFPLLRICCHYNDVMFMADTYFEQGSLQNALNVIQCMDELLVLFYASQMLRMLSQLATDSIVHTRISLDHLLIRSADLDEMWSAQYRADGSAGWAGRGLALTGFSKAVDFRLLSTDQHSFSLDGNLRGHEHDMRAIFSVLTQLLAPGETCPLTITAAHQFASLWNKTFNFLNSSFAPTTSTELTTLIDEVDSTLELASTQCSPTLKGLLTKLEIALLNTQ